MLYQHITAYTSAIKFTRLILGNVCVQAEGMLKLFKSLLKTFSIDPAPCRNNRIKNKVFISNCQPLVLGEHYTKIKA